MTEASLRQQALEAEVAQTRAALESSVDELARRLDPREAARRHRGALIGAAAALGVLVAGMARRRRRRRRRASG